MKKYLTITGPIAAALFIFLYLPLFSVASASLVDPAGGISFKAFANVFNDPALAAAVKNTFLLAVCSTAVATVLGAMLGYGLNRYRFPGKRLFNQVLHVPVFVPDVVLAVSILAFYVVLRQKFGLFERSMLTMICAHVTVQVPFVAIIVRSRLEVWAATYEEAAADLGASSGQRYRKVTIPLIKPSILAGSLLAFTLSLSDFVISFSTAGSKSTTVPILLYSQIGHGTPPPEFNALATIVIATGSLTAIAFALLQRSRKHM